MSKVLRLFREAFKRCVLAEVESGQYTVLHATEAHGINFASFYKRLKEFDEELRTYIGLLHSLGSSQVDPLWRRVSARLHRSLGWV